MTTSSSSEDEEGRSGTTVVRRRRLRKNTACIVTEPEEEELDSSQHEEEEEAGQLEMQTSVKGPSALGVQHVKDHSSSSSTLNKCIMVALIIAVSMGFGHFHGTTLQGSQTQSSCSVSELQVGQQTAAFLRSSDLCVNLAACLKFCPSFAACASTSNVSRPPPAVLSAVVIVL